MSADQTVSVAPSDIVVKPDVSVQQDAKDVVEKNETPDKKEAIEKNEKAVDKVDEVAPEETDPYEGVPNPQDLRVTRAHIQQVMNCIKDLLDGRKITPGMMVRIVANCMMLTRKMKTTSSVSKKIVREGIEAFIRSSDSGLSDDEINILMSMVDVTVEDAFDTLTEVHKGIIKVAPKSCCTIF